MEEVGLQCRIKKKSNMQKVINEREGEKSREQEEGDEGEEWRERGVGGRREVSSLSSSST